MPVFEYEVADPRGALHRGRAEAESQGALILRFREQGRLVVGLRPVGRAGRGDGLAPIAEGMKIALRQVSRRVGLTTLLVFTGQLTAMLAGGLHLARILTALSAGQEGINVTSWQLIVVIGIAFTPPVARTVRSAVLAERDLDYVQAAKLRGERAPYVMFAEILPNVTGPIIVEATVRLGYAVFTIATLAFLSYGPQPPSPDWGSQIAEQYADISLAWWATIFPALAIASLVVAINLIADTVQQVLDE